MKMKQIVLTIMLISPLLLQGQNPRVVRIKPKEVATWNLSQIAEEVTPISLSRYKDLYRNGAESFYITDDYLFIIGGNAIGRLDISWKYIEPGYKTGYFRGDGGITSITGDPDKTETGKGYNLNETFNDDLYHTGNCRPDCFANKPGYFIVRREVSDLKKSFNLKIPTDSPAIYIVKMKSLNPQVKNKWF